MIKSAILFLVFNRPDTTFKVFKKIREVKPSKLYVASDGPRKGFKGEKERVLITRQIATSVDWPCEVKTLFRDKNLGCKKGVSSAITWFFQQEEQGIILEDDCLPHLDFFAFCENLLDRYFSDERISVITGNNFQNGKWRGDASYYFSKYNHCWGWATWRRAWQHYQGDLPFWQEWKKEKTWLNQSPDKIERQYWERIFETVNAGKIDSWAYPWVASTWYTGGLTVTPNMNLVSNIGFGKNSTHTTNENSEFSKMQVKNLGLIKHPKIIDRNIEADKWTFDYHFRGKYLRFPFNLILFLRRMLGYIYHKLKKLF